MQDVPAAPTQIVPSARDHRQRAAGLEEARRGSRARRPRRPAGDSLAAVGGLPDADPGQHRRLLRRQALLRVRLRRHQRLQQALLLRSGRRARWTALASATDTRESPAHGFIGGKLYVVGGWGTAGDADSKMEVYDPAANQWSTGPASPTPYAGAGSAVVGSKLYVVGGCTSTCGATDVYAFDAGAGTWSKLAAYPESTAWLTCAGLPASWSAPAAPRRPRRARARTSTTRRPPPGPRRPTAPAAFWAAAGDRRQRQAAGHRRRGRRRPDQPGLGLRPGGRRLVRAAELQRQRLPLRRRARVLHGRRRPGHTDPADRHHAGAARLHHRPVGGRAMAVGERHDADARPRRLGNLPRSPWTPATHRSPSPAATRPVWA